MSMKPYPAFVLSGSCMADSNSAVTKSRLKSQRLTTVSSHFPRDLGLFKKPPAFLGTHFCFSVKDKMLTPEWK